MMKIMNDCYNRNYNNYDWLIFYEIDEYIHLYNYKNVKLFLNQTKFANCEEILLNLVCHTDNNNLYGICLWNENYIFVGSKDQNIKLIDLKNGLIIKNLEGHKGRIISFKKIILSDNTEQLYSQGLDGKIKLWINK